MQPFSDSNYNYILKKNELGKTVTTEPVSIFKETIQAGLESSKFSRIFPLEDYL